MVRIAGRAPDMLRSGRRIVLLLVLALTVSREGDEGSTDPARRLYRLPLG